MAKSESKNNCEDDLDEVISALLRCYTNAVFSVEAFAPDKAKVSKFISEYKKRHNALMATFSADL